MSIHLYEFSLHQIYKMQQAASTLLRKQQMYSCYTIWLIQKFLIELRRTKFMLNLELAGNTTRIIVTSHIADILLRWYVFQNQLIPNLAVMKNKVLVERGALLKSYIDNKFCPAKVNMIDLIKDSVTEGNSSWVRNIEGYLL